MYKNILIIFLTCFLFCGCDIFGPSDPEEESRVVSIEVIYERDSIACPEAPDQANLLCEKYIPGEMQPEEVYRDMDKKDDRTFESEITVYTEKINIIWVNDPKRYDGFVRASHMYVCTNIYINGTLLERTKPMGAQPWCGKAKFVVHNDGRVETFGES
ncbi:MAG: hypothetical protein GF387_03460 [Candidatus Portnoybacteria bacterium]|nr:hypothetical protein [Candidatus Portnoybacteria bacterium]